MEDTQLTSGSTPPTLFEGQFRALGTLSYTRIASPVTLEPLVTSTGFIQYEGEWITYRRNYFKVGSKIEVHPCLPNKTLTFVSNEQSRIQAGVRGFRVGLSAMIGDTSCTVEILQHTSKRENGPTEQPKLADLKPSNCGPSNRGRSTWIHATAPMRHTFNRMRFNTATKNSHKPNAAQQFFRLKLTVYAHLVDLQTGLPVGDYWTPIGYKKSQNIIVRGRGPTYFKNLQKDADSLHTASYEPHSSPQEEGSRHSPQPDIRDASPPINSCEASSSS